MNGPRRRAETDPCECRPRAFPAAWARCGHLWWRRCPALQLEAPFKFCLGRCDLSSFASTGMPNLKAEADALSATAIRY
jgi:hypothetical protein